LHREKFISEYEGKINLLKEEHCLKIEEIETKWALEIAKEKSERLEQNARVDKNNTKD
jgi:hypothetical protein